MLLGRPRPSGYPLRSLMAEFTSPSYQARHIELNAGNVLAVGALSLLWWGFATWVSAWVAGTDIPVASPLAAGLQTFLHAA